ncbi:MAG TPA: hypothetical protein VHZ07_20765 [Bryobacteraceae bacterium]|jgi:hypothetical protein|nr:hypothetical protein [Bryobacteraceae bacterium]
MSESTAKLTSRRRAALQVVTGAAAAIAMSASAEAAQPRMEAALHALQNAMEQLNAAEADKGGHRVKAMSLVHDAIEEVRRGIRAGR